MTARHLVKRAPLSPHSASLPPSAPTPPRGSPAPEGDARPPLGEAGPHLPVLGEPLAQAVEALGELLLGGEGHAYGALVHLDAGDHALVKEHLRQRTPVGGVLAERLVEEDHAREVLPDALGGEQHLPVSSPALLVGLYADGLEPFAYGPQAPVSREDPPPPRDALPRGPVAPPARPPPARVPMAPKLSSAASIPRPGETSSPAVSSSI